MARKENPIFENLRRGAEARAATLAWANVSSTPETKSRFWEGNWARTILVLLGVGVPAIPILSCIQFKPPAEIIATSTPFPAESLDIPLPTLTATPTRTPTREPIPTPAPDSKEPLLAERVINTEKKLELKGKPGDWKNYFIPVTAKESAWLVATSWQLRSAKAPDGTYTEQKFLLPFDPRRAPNLKLEITGSEPNSYGNLLGIRNLPVGTFFYAPEDGEAYVQRNQEMTTYGSVIRIAIVTVQTEYFGSYRLYMLDQDALALIPENTRTQVSIGTPLISLGTTEIMSGPPYNYQVTFAYQDFNPNYQRYTYPESLNKLLRKERKFVFIQQGQ